MKSYGIKTTGEPHDSNGHIIEEIEINGFAIKEGMFGEAKCDEYVNRIEKVYETQEEEVGRQKLATINELDMARMPFLYDDCFKEIFMHPDILDLVNAVLGQYFNLHLQNAIINRPSRDHHQTSWHRDLPYQEWTISKPIAMNAFVCLTDFTSENGGTLFLPHSHRFENFPSFKYIQEHETQPQAKKGAVIFFDSMVYHRAGINTSKTTRVGINNMYIAPILRQQIDIPRALGPLPNASPLERQILGYDHQTPSSVLQFRKRYLDRLEVAKTV